ncbi:hypothetical protein J1N35_001066 [Gossypium stocksii]|uniref:Uncharacterized protein n=1 Tax=Gossypium stocksii TaxID=47602 RepID=A0A9D3WJQ5_9ROSI|nr:hypothetical protein J1N35_001066 [Gossypium stocksii]
MTVMRSRIEVADTFNLPSYSKAGTVVDARRVSSGERLFRWSKGNAPFRLTAVAIIKKAINNYNHCRIDPSLTSTFTESSILPLRILLCLTRCQPLDKDERLNILARGNREKNYVDYTENPSILPYDYGLNLMYGIYNA